jgi:hypothetical protein
MLNPSVLPTAANTVTEMRECAARLNQSAGCGTLSYGAMRFAYCRLTGCALHGLYQIISTLTLFYSPDEFGQDALLFNPGDQPLLKLVSSSIRGDVVDVPDDILNDLLRLLNLLLSKKNHG